VIGVAIIKGQGNVSLPEAVLVMTTPQPIWSLRCQIAESGHELAVRERDMVHHGRWAKWRVEATKAALASAGGQLQALVEEAEEGCTQILAFHNGKATFSL
jgi:hypothetical protein